MLQAHSPLWHYLWVAPNLYLLVLTVILWRRRLHKQLPIFVAFAILASMGELAVYTADVSPSVSAENFWKTDWVSLVIGSLLKFALIAEIFSHAFNPYVSVAKLGKFLIRTVGATLVLATAVVAAIAPKDSPYGLINGAHFLELAIYIIETGLLVFIFLYSSHFRLRLGRPDFGIALGLAVSSSVHLATWAIAATLGLPASKRVILDFVNMATYHISVMIWYYYLLIPVKARSKPADPPQDPPTAASSGTPSAEDMEALNEEMERLLHR
jgi:hypothetical protein